MQNKSKVLFLTLLTTISFLIRDTLRISGPINMKPTFIVLFISSVSSFFLIYILEDKKTNNHSKLKLATIGASVALLGIFSAYILEIQSYIGKNFFQTLASNFALAANNILDFGFLIIITNIIFGILVGSNKNNRDIYNFKSSKHTTKENRYK